MIAYFAIMTRFRGGQQLANGFKEVGDGGIVSFKFSLQFGQLAGKFVVSGQQLAKVHEGAHNNDVNINCALTI